MNIKVRNMESSKGNKVANQFIIDNATFQLHPKDGGPIMGTLFQSYNSNIAFCSFGGHTFLYEKFWNYSVTTSKYRGMFLGESKKETEAKIKSGVYKLVNLN